MTRSTLLSGIFALLGGALLHAAELAPYTPPKDLQGNWTVHAQSNRPNVLLLGDSISIGYTPAVRTLLASKANVFRAMKPDGKGIDNCGDTVIGLKNLDAWLGTNRWAVIHFNWGLWDLCYRNPEVKGQGNRDKVNGKLSVTPEDYERNLEKLVTRLKPTGARLIWASTTVVPENEPGRIAGDEVKYNAVAARVMARHSIAINDLHALSQSFAGKYSPRSGDVHYTDAGSEALAKQVAAEILKVLAGKQ